MQFQVLSDVNNIVAKKYNLVFKLPPKIAVVYENLLRLSEFNGNHKSELPMAATYVIKASGEIAYAFIDADYRKRAEPKNIVEVLQNLKN